MGEDCCSIPRRRPRASRVALPLVAAAMATGQAGAASPPLIWRDVAQIGVQCVVVPAPSALRASLQKLICDRVIALATPDAPGPVTAIAVGDPAILAPARVTLLVHASARPAPGGQLIAFTIRPFRVSQEQTSVLYGAAPRAATLPDAGTNARREALDAALVPALAETLPWFGPRPK